LFIGASLVAESPKVALLVEQWDWPEVPDSCKALGPVDFDECIECAAPSVSGRSSSTLATISIELHLQVACKAELQIPNG
jgi:hypothetical protein